MLLEGNIEGKNLLIQLNDCCKNLYISENKSNWGFVNIGGKSISLNYWTYSNFGGYLANLDEGLIINDSTFIISKRTIFPGSDSYHVLEVYRNFDCELNKAIQIPHFMVDSPL